MGMSSKSLLTQPWLFPVLISFWALMTGQHQEAIYMMLFGILTTQSDYFGITGGDTDGSE
jgi:hypothetical protein